MAPGGPPDRQIPEFLAELAVDLFGARPFYLQMLGDAITRTEPPYDQSTLKATVQDLLFSSMGRLSLYFENELERLVGRSTNLASVLESLATGPKRLGEIAKAIGAPPGQTRSYVARLADAVQHTKDGRYALDDSRTCLVVRKAHTTIAGHFRQVDGFPYSDSEICSPFSKTTNDVGVIPRSLRARTNSIGGSSWPSSDRSNVPQ